MKIRNVDERVVSGSPDDIAPLLASLGQPDDALYPPQWQPMRLDRPVAIGATGTHGTISAYEPGRLLEFTFPRGMGITGTHTFTVRPLGPGESVVRHEVDADATVVAWLGWQAVIRSSHDAVLECLLDRLQSELGAPPERPAAPSVYARALRRIEGPRARKADPARSALLSGALDRVDYADAFAIERRRNVSDDPQAWVDAVFNDPPAWVTALMGLRDRLVQVAGIERSTPDTFAVIARDDDEVVLGSDAGHLNFRASIRREVESTLLTTTVQLHNRRGRAYFALIRPFHALVVRAMLNRAAGRVEAEVVRLR